MTLRLGLLAASRIAKDAVVDPVDEVEDVEIVALAARDPGRGQRFAAQWGVGRACTYAELLAADDVDAVYIGTPAALHRRWTVAAVQAGKHVLVEKPLAANAEDAAMMAAAADASGLVVMEAFHWRYHPLVGQMREILDTLGPIKRVEASFAVAAVHIPTTDIRYDLSLGGGSMMDIGVYPLGWVTWVFGERPRVVSAEAHCDVPEVDSSMVVELEGPGGATATVLSSMVAPGRDRPSSLIVRGERATMLVTNPLAPQFGSTLLVETPVGRTEHPVSRDATYLHQLRAFRNAVVTGTPFPTTVTAGVEIMGLIDDSYRAAGLRPRPSLRDQMG